MPTISVNGAALFAVEEGDGDPIVLVHGTVADYRTWLLQIREFSKQYRVIAYSRRFHFPDAAGSENSPYAIATQAQDLAEVIRARAGGSAHVVTSSFGGCVALTLAVSQPGLFRSLVLCEPPLMPWLLTSVEGKKMFSGVREAQDASNRAFKAGNPREGVRLFCDMAIGRGVFDAMAPRSQARMMDNAVELSLEMATSAEVYFPRFRCEELGRLEVPVLFLSSDSSPSHYRVITAELLKCLPRAEHLTITNTAHVIHGANPAAFNKTVSSFMERALAI